MFGDPSGMAPEKHQKGGGDVLLGSGSLAALLTAYTSIVSATYDCVYYQERVFIGFEKYSPEGIDYSLNPLTRLDQQYRAVYGTRIGHTWVETGGGEGGISPSYGYGPGGGESSANKNTYTNSWEDVLNSFDLSEVDNYLGLRFTDDLKEMYEVDPDFFEGLKKVTEPIKVCIEPASVLLEMDKDNAKLLASGLNGKSASFYLSSDGNHVLSLPEEVYTQDFSALNEKTKLGYFYYLPDNSNSNVSLIIPSFSLIAHELGHVFDMYIVGGYYAYFTFDYNYQEWAANCWENRMRRAMGYPDKYDGIDDDWFWFLWWTGIHKKK